MNSEHTGAGGQRGTIMARLKRIPRIRGFKFPINKVGGLKGFKFDRAKVKALKFRPPGRCLVFETTGTALYGAVATAGFGPDPRLGPVAVSREADSATALAEVLAALKGQSRLGLPKKAVLVTPSASGALIRLPVNPKKPRPAEQMGEMVRWELEEVFVGQGDIWSLGALLQGQGLISAEQRERIESESQGPVFSGSSLYKDIVDPARLNDCLELQERLAEMDDEMVTGWQAVSQAGAGDEEGGFPWYCAGVGERIRSAWAGAFEQHKIFLSWVYPQLGAVFPLIPSGDGGWLVVDVRQEQFCIAAGEGRQFEAFGLHPCVSGRAVPGQVAEAVNRRVHSRIRTLYVSAPADQAGMLVGALETGFKAQGISIVPVEPAVRDGCPGEIMTSLEGTARHLLGRTLGLENVRIRARAPKPPLWKNKSLWPWAGIVLILAGIIGYEAHIRDQTAKNEWALELAEIEYEKKMKIKRQAQHTISEVTALEERLAGKEAELAEQLRLKDILENIIRYRQDFIPGILQAVGSAVTDAVVVDLVEENRERSGFFIKAWALQDTEATLFGNRLNEALAPWRYKVADVKLERGKGRLDLDGFVMEIRLVKMNPEIKEKT